MSIYGSPVSPWDSDEILRAELFSSERLEAACGESGGGSARYVDGVRHAALWSHD